MIVVADSGPLIHLSLIGSLGLLPDLYGQILIPDLVYDEVVNSGEGLPGSREVAGASWIAVEKHDPKSDLFRLLRGDLDAGEAAAICLAIDRHAEWFLSDDRPARLTAERMGLQVCGSVGVLAAANAEAWYSGSRLSSSECGRRASGSARSYWRKSFRVWASHRSLSGETRLAEAIRSSSPLRIACTLPSGVSSSLSTSSASTSRPSSRSSWEARRAR